MWRTFARDLGKKISLKKSKKWDIRDFVDSQFKIKNQEKQILFVHIESFVVDPFRGYCNAIYRRIDAQKDLVEKTKSTEDLRENIFKEGDNIIDVFENTFRSEDKSNNDEKLQE